MGLNVKNDVVERDVRELARRRGVGVTEAIGLAVSEALKRQPDREAPELKRIMAILDGMRDPGDPPVEEPGSFLYGEDGLPT